MTLEELACKASGDLHAAYWVACDDPIAANDPAEFTTETWAAELLAEAHDIALRIEEDPLGWDEGDAKW